jgi:hypothetical protein
MEGIKECQIVNFPGQTKIYVWETGVNTRNATRFGIEHFINKFGVLETADTLRWSLQTASLGRRGGSPLPLLQQTGVSVETIKTCAVKN